MLPAAVVSAVIKVDGMQTAVRQLTDFSAIAKKTQGAVGGLTRSTSTVKPAADKASTGLKGFAERTHSTSLSVKSLATDIIAAGGAFAAFELAKNAINNTIELGNATERLSAATGIDTKVSSEWLTTMKVRGESTTATDRAFISLSRNLRNAQSGSVAALKSFKELGISQAELQRTNPAKLMGLIAQGFKNTIDPAHRAAVAQQLFGVGTQALIPVLLGGRKGIDQMLASAQRFGAYLPDNAKKMNAAINAAESWHLALQGLQISFTQAFLPTLLIVAGAIEKFIAQMRSGKGAGGQFERGLEVVWGVLKKVFGVVVDVVKWLARMYEQFVKGKPTVVALAGALAGLAVALKVAAIAQGILDAAALADPYVAAAVAIAALVGALVLLYIKLKPFRDTVNAVGRAIISAFKTAVHIVEPYINGLIGVVKHVFGIIQGIIEVFSGIFSGNFKKMWEGIKKIFSNWLGAIIDGIKGAVGSFLNLGKAIMDAIGKGLESAAQAVINKMIDFVNALASPVNAVIGLFNDVTGAHIGDLKIKHVHFADSSKTPTFGDPAHQLSKNFPALQVKDRLSRTFPESAQRHLKDTADHTRAIRRNTQAPSIQVPRVAPTVTGLTATENAIKKIDQQRLGLETQRAALETQRGKLDTQYADATTKAAKARLKSELDTNSAKLRGLASEIRIVDLRKQGLVLQERGYKSSDTAQKKALAEQQKAAKLAQEAAKKQAEAVVQAFSRTGMSNMQAQIRMQQIQNRIAVATNAGNIGGEQAGYQAERRLDEAWLNEDKRKLTQINRLLAKRGISKAERAGLIKDKLALLQEIGQIEGDIGSVASSLNSLAAGTGSTSSASGGSFDLAPGGGSIVNPTFYDIAKASKPQTQEVHHHHHGDVNVTVSKEGDEQKVYDALDQFSGGRLNARLRRNGLKTT